MLWRRIVSKLIAVGAIAGVAGCGGGYRVVGTPFDANGRSLNSLYAEQQPHLAGDFVAFVSDRRGSKDVYLFNLRERRLIELPDLNRLDTLVSNPAVSQDGRYIAFVASRDGQQDIYIYDQTTRQARNLTDNLTAEVRRPSISADGSKIAFEAAIEGQWDILLYDRSGQPVLLDQP